MQTQAFCDATECDGFDSALVEQGEGFADDVVPVVPLLVHGLAFGVDYTKIRSRHLSTTVCHLKQRASIWASTGRTVSSPSKGSLQCAVVLTRL